ncbi:MAG: hypothetical protein QW279_15540 [Candidatus Jordarchaeaceae archaeon]
MSRGPLADEMLRLFEELISVMEQAKRIKREDVPSKLIFEMYNMTDNSKSKIFAESALYLDPELAETLHEEGFIQKIRFEDSEKYALTLKGIAQCIQLKYGVTLDKQFLNFLELSDRKFNMGGRERLQWDEKLASLSLILLGSTSPSSAIRLNNEQNKSVLTEVFQSILSCMKKFNIIEKEYNLRTVDRGEAPVSALMSRLNALPRKTNHCYKIIGKGSEYYFDIEKENNLDERKLFFLLKQIFEHYDPNCNYAEMYEELAEISQLYYPRFISRTVNPLIILTILQKLKEFLTVEIYRLPMKMQ